MKQTGPTKEISEELVKEFNIDAIFYDPDNFDDLKEAASRIQTFVSS